MTRIVVLTVAAVAPLLSATDDQKLQAKTVAITHVTVIDPIATMVLPDRNVLITGDRISAIGKAREVAIPPGAQIVDGAGKYLIPGLWDMHAHIAAARQADARIYLNLYLANGVTGVREMHAYFPELIFGLRQEIAAGKIAGPRIIAAGAMIDGPNPTSGGALVAASAEQGRAAVLSLKKRGADFIKVHSKLPRDAYFAIAEEAKRQGLPFAGHVPESVSAAEASDAGQKSIEHLTGLWVSCSTQEEALRKEATEALQAGQANDLALLLRVLLKPMDNYSATKARALYQRFARNHTWQTPTLVLARSLASLEDSHFTSDSRVRYMPGIIRGFWDLHSPQNQAIINGLANLRQIFRRSAAEVAKMHQAGVEILTGTDTPFPFCFPGFSVHDELALLVEESKFTPMEALRCATCNPAKFLGKESDLGVIAKGKIADLVLLDANPLEDIRNTQMIAAVMANGKLLSKPELQKMLAEVEAAVSGK